MLDVPDCALAHNGLAHDIPSSSTLVALHIELMPAHGTMHEGIQLHVHLHAASAVCAGIVPSLGACTKATERHTQWRGGRRQMIPSTHTRTWTRNAQLSCPMSPSISCRGRNCCGVAGAEHTQSSTLQRCSIDPLPCGTVCTAAPRHPSSDSHKWTAVATRVCATACNTAGLFSLCYLHPRCVWCRLSHSSTRPMQDRVTRPVVPSGFSKRCSQRYRAPMAADLAPASLDVVTYSNHTPIAT